MDHEDLAEVCTRQADALARDREYDQALALYDRAIEADPELVDARIGKAGVLRVLGRLHEALACINEALAFSPSPVAEMLRERVVDDMKRKGLL